MTLIERKFLGYFHMRVGPNRTGLWGLLQPIADAIKSFVKEDIIPAGADPFVFRLAPVISVFTALAAWAVIPVGPPVEIAGRLVPLQVADPPAGVLVTLAFSALSVYGISLAGWASQSKYSLLGGMRAAAQLISYELALAMSVLGVMMLAGSLRLSDIVAAQADRWFIALQPLGFLIFLIAGIAERRGHRAAGGGNRAGVGLRRRVQRHALRHVHDGGIRGHDYHLGPGHAALPGRLARTGVLAGGGVVHSESVVFPVPFYLA